jgi:hypothetical protein
MGGAWFFYEELVVEEIDCRRAHEARGNLGCGRGEGGEPEIVVLLPHEHVAEELAARAAFGKVRRVRTGLYEVALDRLAENSHPHGVEGAAQADDAVAIIGGDVGVGDGDQVGERTWMARFAICSRVLAA